MDPIKNIPQPWCKGGNGPLDGADKMPQKTASVCTRAPRHRLAPRLVRDSSINRCFSLFLASRRGFVSGRKLSKKTCIIAEPPLHARRTSKKNKKSQNSQNTTEKTASLSPNPPAIPPMVPVDMSMESKFVQSLFKGEWLSAFREKNPGWVKCLESRCLEKGVQVTDNSVKQLFSWAPEMEEGDKAQQRLGLAKAFEDLLDLDVGRNLVADIIFTYHSYVGSPVVRFFYGPKVISQCIPSKYPNPWNIRIGGSGHHNSVLVVSNPVTNSLDFVGINIPVAAVLAHELGHFAYAINARQRVAERLDIDHVCGDALRDKNSNGGYFTDGPLQAALADVIDRVEKFVLRCPFTEHRNILRGIINDEPTEEVEKFFRDCWCDDGYLEILNILPSAGILKNGGIVYSDGDIIGEILRQWNKSRADYPTFFGSNVQALNIQYGEFAKFVSFGHWAAGDFFTRYSALKPEEQENFRKLTQGLLDKIEVNGVSLAPQNNNLPEVA